MLWSQESLDKLKRLTFTKLTWPKYSQLKILEVKHLLFLFFIMFFVSMVLDDIGD